MELPEGYAVRSPRMEDGPAVVHVWNSDSIAWNGYPDATLDWVTAPWKTAGSDLEHDFGVVATAGGEVAAYFMVQSEPPHTSVFGLGGVAAAHHGRGLGGAILDELERRAGRHAEMAPPEADVLLRVGSIAGERNVAALLGARGYEEVRRFWEMRIAFEVPPVAPDPVPGVEIRPLTPGGEIAVHRCLAAAFADHWGGPFESQERFMARWVQAQAFEPSLWRLAWRSDSLLGALVGERSHGEGSDIGEVALIGVLREARGHGIGEALLRSSFQAFAERGCSGASLIVDSESTTGATRLYERVGMTSEPRYATWQKLLRAGETSP